MEKSAPPPLGGLTLPPHPPYAGDEPSYQRELRPQSLPPVNPATKILRELYVGNTPADVLPTQLKDFLNAAMRQGMLGSSAGNAVLQCRCNKGFAFIEFRTEDDANSALHLKLTLQGSKAHGATA